ncbi:hypothetical protein D3C84_536670 [compost metagenome]
MMSVASTGSQRRLRQFMVLTLLRKRAPGLKFFNGSQIRVKLQLPLIGIEQHLGTVDQRQHLHR